MQQRKSINSVLIVDDEPSNLDLLTAILGDTYKLYAAIDGRTALKLASSCTPPDIILLDVMMPDMDGFDVIKALKLDPLTKQIPVIFISAMITPEAEERGLILGAVDYIFKPYNSTVIIAKLKLHMALLMQRNFIGSLLAKKLKEQVLTKVDLESQHEEIIEHLKQKEEDRERFSLALRSCSTEFWDWDIANDTFYCSDQLKIFAPIVSDEKTGIRSFIDHFHENDMAEIKNKIEQIKLGKVSKVELNARLKNNNHDWLWTRVIAEVVKYPAAESVSFISGTISDISDSRKMEKNLRIMGLCFDNTSDGIWIANSDFIIQAVNIGYTNITGYLKEEVIGKPLELIATDQAEGSKFLNNVIKVLNETGNWKGEFTGAGKNIEFCQELHIDQVNNVEDGETLYIGIFNDVTYRKKSEKDLMKLANYDSLTDLPNRTLLTERLNQAISGKREGSSRFALLFLDLDNFKNINDSLGHSTGDELLRKVAKRMLSIKRPEDLIARLGGDEFIFFIDGIFEPHKVARICERILNTMKRPFILKGHETVVTPSIGISFYPDNGPTIDELMKNADLAMYEAKRQGKNHYVFVTNEMNKEALNRLILEKELRSAIERNEITLHYQPKVSLQSGKMTGMEVLARWYLNDEFISPDLFIPIAEESGLILKLGKQILFKACKQCQEWLEGGYEVGKMAVNISSVQFLVEDLIDDVRVILQKTRLNPICLELEITESTVMRDVEKAVHQMHELRKLGVSLAIDDFGTGYSSLSYLKSFPINTLKIDRCFIVDMLSSKRDEDIVSSIINLGHVLGLEIVAEGVETVEQMQRLKKLDAEELQGFYYSRPIPAEEFERLMGRDKNLFKI